MNLVKIAETLTRYAQGGAIGTIPTVHIDFTHNPTDIGVDDWTLKVVLEAYEKINDDGTRETVHLKNWEYMASDPQIAYDRVLKDIHQFLQSAVQTKTSELSAVESALQMFENSDQPLPWENADQQALAEREEAGDGWTGELPGAGPSGEASFVVFTNT